MVRGRRKWQPTPVSLSGESHRQRSLVDCCPWGHIESDMTEATLHACMHWGKKWQPIPVFLPGESQGQRRLVGPICGVAQSRMRLKRLSSSSSQWLGLSAFTAEGQSSIPLLKN